LHHHLETAGSADAAHRRRRDRDDEGVLDFGEALAQIGHDMVGAEPLGGAFLEWLERRKDRPGVGCVCEGCAVEPGELHGVRDPRRITKDLRGTSYHGVGAGK